MSDDLKKLLELARHHPPSVVDQQKQRLSFAYGNANIENSDVTRATVERMAKKLDEDEGA